MPGNDIALWAALVGLAAMIWDRKRGSSTGSGGLTVTGGSVAIDASNAVETATVYEYIGPNLCWTFGSMDWTQPKETWCLTTGDAYDDRIDYDIAVTEGQWIWVDQKLRQLNRAQWDLYWVPFLASVQDQIDLSVRKIPAALRTPKP
jgi:hypothetical protein